MPRVDQYRVKFVYSPAASKAGPNGTNGRYIGEEPRNGLPRQAAVTKNPTGNAGCRQRSSARSMIVSKPGEMSSGTSRLQLLVL
jgi:hypothetical protein